MDQTPKTKDYISDISYFSWSDNQQFKERKAYTMYYYKIEHLTHIFVYFEHGTIIIIIYELQ